MPRCRRGLSASACVRACTSAGRADRRSGLGPCVSKRQAAPAAREMPTSISFEGCGAAISYHLAVYEAACRVYGRETLQAKKVKYVGTSSGSIAALIAALGLDAAFWKGMPVIVCVHVCFHSLSGFPEPSRPASQRMHTHKHTHRSASTAVGSDGEKVCGSAASRLLCGAGPR